MIELHTQEFAAVTLDFIADLVIEPIEIGVVEGLLGFFYPWYVALHSFISVN